MFAPHPTPPRVGEEGSFIFPVILSVSEVSQGLIAKTPNYCDSPANASERRIELCHSGFDPESINVGFFIVLIDPESSSG